MLELDEEDYELLSGSRSSIFDLAFKLESRLKELAALPKRKRKPESAVQKFIRNCQQKARYVPKQRKPRKEPWAKRNPEKNAERKLKWYYAHKEQVRKYQAEWRAKNPDYMKNYAAKRRKEKK